MLSEASTKALKMVSAPSEAFTKVSKMVSAPSETSAKASKMVSAPSEDYLWGGLDRLVELRIGLGW